MSIHSTSNLIFFLFFSVARSVGNILRRAFWFIGIWARMRIVKISNVASAALKISLQRIWNLIWKCIHQTMRNTHIVVNCVERGTKAISPSKKFLFSLYFYHFFFFFNFQFFFFNGLLFQKFLEQFQKFLEHLSIVFWTINLFFEQFTIQNEKVRISEKRVQISKNTLKNQLE